MKYPLTGPLSLDYTPLTGIKLSEKPSSYSNNCRPTTGSVELMNLTPFRPILSILIELFTLAPIISVAEERYVYPGALLKSRGASLAAHRINSNLSELQGVRGARLRSVKLAKGIVLVEELPVAGVTIQATDAAPLPLTGQRDPCRRAKIRRVMHEIGGHVTCSPNFALFASDISANAVAPNDPYYYLQYGPAQMNLTSAWDTTVGSSEVVVQVIDTGIQYTHPDLAANIWTNPGEVAGNGIDDDANGYIDDLHGINAITNSGDPMDDHYHGTHVAGIIGAVGNNGVGVTGAAWSVKMIATKFLSSTGSGSTSNAIKSINYGTMLRNRGVNLIASNNSWGGGSYNSVLASAIADAGNAGIMFVAAAGNAAQNTDTTPSYPACYSSNNVISVASNNSAGTLSYFSNYGASTVDISAPGESIVSTMTTNAYSTLSGTSMAAPQITGLLVLAQSMCPNRFSVGGLKDILLNSGTVTPALSGKVATSAIANAAGVVAAASALCNSSLTPTTSPTATQTSPAADTSTPTPTPTPTPTTDITASPVPTSAPSPTTVPTAIPTIIPTATPTSTPTSTATSTPQSIP